MALNFDFTKVKGTPYIFHTSQEGKDEGRGHYYPTTDALIWLCMMLDMRGITKDNVDEFWFRLTMWREIGGEYFSYVKDFDKEEIGISPWEITKADIEACIGLDTNVSQKTRKQFVNRQMRILSDRCENLSKSNHPSKLFNEELRIRFDVARERVVRDWEDDKVRKAMERAEKEGKEFNPVKQEA